MRVARAKESSAARMSVIIETCWGCAGAMKQRVGQTEMKRTDVTRAFERTGSLSASGVLMRRCARRGAGKGKVCAGIKPSADRHKVGSACSNANDAAPRDAHARMKARALTGRVMP